MTKEQAILEMNKLIKRKSTAERFLEQYKKLEALIVQDTKRLIKLADNLEIKTKQLKKLKKSVEICLGKTF